jgi:hypothetical protein
MRKQKSRPLLIDQSIVDPRIVKTMDMYRRVATIYERAAAAMGRVPKYKITMSNTRTVRIGDGGGSST